MTFQSEEESENVMSLSITRINNEKFIFQRIKGSKMILLATIFCYFDDGYKMMISPHLEQRGQFYNLELKLQNCRASIMNRT